MELEEEKKAKEQRDKRLIEQAKKIENLSSLVLNSERDDRTTVSSKVGMQFIYLTSTCHKMHLNLMFFSFLLVLYFHLAYCSTLLSTKKCEYFLDIFSKRATIFRQITIRSNESIPQLHRGT